MISRVISITTVFINKKLFDGVGATLFVTWIQCIVSTFICVTATFLCRKFPQYVRISLPEAKPFAWDTVKNVIPLAILFAMMIGLNNLCLKNVAVAFYYIGRSLTTIFNVVLAYAFLKERQSVQSILCCGVIVGGFWLGVEQESLTDTFSSIGTIYGVLGSFVLALFSIYTKKTLPYVNGEVWLLSYYNNVYSCFLFIPLMFLNGEVEAVRNYEHIGELRFWGALIFGGLCGFMIGYVTTLQIKVTSPLTHNISGTSKACAQTVIATAFFEDPKLPPKSLLWWTSNVIVLLGSFLYARVKQVEMAVKHQQGQRL